MSKKSALQVAVIAVVLMTLLSFEALFSGNVQPAEAKVMNVQQPNCAATTNADLVKAVKESLSADSQIKDQMRHLNVSVKNRIVTLEGWLDGKATVSKAIVIARKTKCVRKVINRLKIQGGGSCGPGQQICGDICIDKRSECTIGESNQ